MVTLLETLFKVLVALLMTAHEPPSMTMVLRYIP